MVGRVEIQAMYATKYSEDQLIRWTKPASDSEENRIENTITMVRSAINQYDWQMNGFLRAPVVDLKGSYKSNTNVRRDSDVDIYALFEDYSYTVDAFQGISACHQGSGPITCSVIHSHLGRAQKNKFGASVDDSGSKAFKIRSGSYRVDADVTPFVTAKHENHSYENGMCFMDTKGLFFVNYPAQDQNNGVRKNDDTGRTYKRIVRILKYIRNDIGLDAPSFLIESLIYNAPDYLFNDTIFAPTTYAQKIRRIAQHLYSIVKNQSQVLYEVNQIKKLFSEKQKWEPATAITLLENVYGRLEE